MVAVVNKAYSPLSVAEKVSSEKGRILLDNSEIPLSIFTEKELNLISVTDSDVISELNGSSRYPVIKSNTIITVDAELRKDEYFAAPDDRNRSGHFTKISHDKIYGRIEGILFSPGGGFVAGKISLPAEY